MRFLGSRILVIFAKSFEIVGALFHKISLSLSWWRFRHVVFIPRESDIYIATYPRSGTTWMQNILYQLTSDGSMDFIHISEKIPWFEFLAYQRKDVNKFNNPRIFKTHLPLRKLPRKGKYIYVYRDGLDVMQSMYHFYRSHRNYRGKPDQFFYLFLKGRVLYGSWFRHIRGWKKAGKKARIHYLSYSDLKSNFDSAIAGIAKFIGKELNPEELDRLRNTCSFEFMKNQEDKFDAITELLLQQGIRRKSFIRDGREGGGRKFVTEKQRRIFETQQKKFLGETVL